MHAWTLESAVELVSELNSKVMPIGYYLAIAGGVVNNGYSDNDLDLVAMPRTESANKLVLLQKLVANGFHLKSVAPVAAAVVCTFTYNGKKIDVSIVRVHKNDSTANNARVAQLVEQSPCNR